MRGPLQISRKRVVNLMLCNDPQVILFVIYYIMPGNFAYPSWIRGYRSRAKESSIEAFQQLRRRLPLREHGREFHGFYEVLSIHAGHCTGEVSQVQSISA